jgi:isopenicillin N synthase-like dioxygenase
MSVSPFPTFDLDQFERAGRDEKRALAALVDAVCRATGFLAISRHGVPATVIEAAWQKAYEFFDLPPETKRRARAPYPGYPYGYLGPELESLAKSLDVEAPPDLKESFNGGPRRPPEGMTDPEALGFCYAPTIWPEQPVGFEAAWQTYYDAMEDLAARLMRLFAAALGLPETYFERYIDAPISALRALNYPRLEVAPAPGQLRAGAHTDYGSLTILLPQIGSRGLEILSPDGVWTPVPPQRDAFIVNIGDLMARWTNDRWVSTLHRVANPSPEQGGGDRRQSFAFFHQPNWDAEICVLQACLAQCDTPKYGPVRSGPYLMSKFKSTTI